MSKNQITTLVAIVAFVVIAISFVIPVLAPRDVVPQESKPPSLACDVACSLIVEPDDGIAPILTLIKNAKRSIDLVMYQLQDGTIEAALVAAQKRGVKVRVILSTGYKGEPSAINQAAFETFEENHVAVHWSANYFDLTHEKSMVIDSTTGLIMSFNFVPRFYPTGRDFGIIDGDENDVAAMEGAFDSDWQGSNVSASPGDDLVWSPGSRNVLITLINGATQSLNIYNEEMADQEIITALIDAAERGVVVDILMTYSPGWKAAFKRLTGAGAVVHTYPAHAARYIHAKMIMSDGKQAFVGSENFSATSLDWNRELGLLVKNKGLIQALGSIFFADWRASKIFRI